MPQSWDVYALTRTGRGAPGDPVLSTAGARLIAALPSPADNFGDGTYEGAVSIAGAVGHVLDYPDLGALLFVPAGVAVGACGRCLLTTSPVPDACFAAGTRLRTPQGWRPVEALRQWDRVLTAGGEERPVRWLGRSTVATFAGPVRRLPIRIRAGALAENRPARDLVVSPGHAILLNGVLVQAGALVNGTSIVRDREAPEAFTYYHVELDAHDLLLAEGALAESFLIGAGDMAFDNWAERPAGLGVAAEMAFPRVRAVRQLPALVAGRAAAIAPALAAAIAPALAAAA